MIISTSYPLLDMEPTRTRDYDLIIDSFYEIEDEEIWENQTVFLDSNLDITGALILKNTTLVVNHTYDIRIEGFLNMSDLDGDPKTTGDRSEILGNATWITSISSINGSLNIHNSFISNSFLGGSIMEIESTRLEDSLISLHQSDRLINSSLESIDFKPQYAVSTLTTSILNIINVTIKDYPGGIMNNGGALEIRDSRILNCTRGISSKNGSRTYIRSTNILNSSKPLDPDGLMDLKDSMIFNGSIDMGMRSLISRNTVYEQIRGVENIQTGQVLNSTFRKCEIGLDEPRGVTVRESRFVLCGVAISEPRDCLIYHNSFIDNQKDTEGIPVSDWYSTSLKEGNHYTSYNGKDDGTNGRIQNDGIGDTELPHLGRDPYPLMKDGYWDMPYIPELSLNYLTGTGTVNLSWTSDSDLDGVLIQRSRNSDFQRDLTTWSVSGNNISIEDNPNSTLYFRIAGFNPTGFRGWSQISEVEVDQAPLTPVKIKVEPLPGGGELKVSWNDRGEDINKTKTTYSKRTAQPIQPEVVPFPENETVINDLENGVIYNISIYTEDSKGQLSLFAVNVTGIPMDIVPPPPPRSLYAMPIDNTSVEIGWDPPYIQDISAYLLYRRIPGGEYSLIANLSRLAIRYIDEGLEDNTTYQYGIAALDDDGPRSKVAGPVEVTTLHVNQPPEFFSGIELIYMTEDNGSYSIDTDNIAYDPDGDPIIISVDSYSPIKAEIIEDRLWILPEPDQSGEGFVKIRVSDGEVNSFLIMGIIIEGHPDPPRDVAIISPSNGSVHLPGTSVLLQGDAKDPDIPYGDNLTYIWTSDKDGPLNGQGSFREHMRITLSPGVHNITLEVSDSTGLSVIRNVTVLISLWGWGEFPWSARIISLEANEDGGRVTLRIDNGGPIQLTFVVSPADISTAQILGERGILIGPSASGDLVLELIGPFQEGDILTLLLEVEGETLNGTYAGDLRLNGTVEVEGSQNGDSPEMLLLILLLVFSLIAILCLIIIFIVGKGIFMKGYRDEVEDDKNG
jgi:hypothetical protein